MSEFVTNDDMFGKYCKIPTGYSRAEHIYKIVARIESNIYCDIPLLSGSTKEIAHERVIPVLLVIHCGIDESEVIRAPLDKCKICAAPSGWISVKDRLPDTSRYVIGCFGGYVFECWYHTVDKHWVRHGIAIVEDVTHWRELPDPPRMEENKE